MGIIFGDSKVIPGAELPLLMEIDDLDVFKDFLEWQHELAKRLNDNQISSITGRIASDPFLTPFASSGEPMAIVKIQDEHNPEVNVSVAVPKSVVARRHVGDMLELSVVDLYKPRGDRFFSFGPAQLEVEEKHSLSDIIEKITPPKRFIENLLWKIMSARIEFHSEKREIAQKDFPILELHCPHVSNCEVSLETAETGTVQQEISLSIGGFGGGRGIERSIRKIEDIHVKGDTGPCCIKISQKITYELDFGRFHFRNHTIAYGVRVDIKDVQGQILYETIPLEKDACIKEKADLKTLISRDMRGVSQRSEFEGSVEISAGRTFESGLDLSFGLDALSAKIDLSSELKLGGSSLLVYRYRLVGGYSYTGYELSIPFPICWDFV